MRVAPLTIGKMIGMVGHDDDHVDHPTELIISQRIRLWARREALPIEALNSRPGRGMHSLYEHWNIPFIALAEQLARVTYDVEMIADLFHGLLAKPSEKERRLWNEAVMGEDGILLVVQMPFVTHRGGVSIMPAANMAKIVERDDANETCVIMSLSKMFRLIRLDDPCHRDLMQVSRENWTFQRPTDEELHSNVRTREKYDPAPKQPKRKPVELIEPPFMETVRMQEAAMR